MESRHQITKNSTKRKHALKGKGNSLLLGKRNYYDMDEYLYSVTLFKVIHIPVQHKRSKRAH